MGLLPLEFTECLQDSPYFRDSLHSHEKELERTSNNMKELIKEVKNLFNAAKVLSAAQRRLSSTLVNFKFECIGNQQTDDEIIIAGSLKEFGGLISAIEDERDRMLNQAYEQFIIPLENFRKEQVGAVKEGKKKFDKLTAKFCASQERHLGLSRKKQDTVLQDADAGLEMEHRDFIRAGLEYVCLIQEVQERKKFEFVETLLGFMYGWLTFYHQGHEVAKDYKPHMTELQTRIQKTRDNFNASRADIHALMAKMLEVRQSKQLDPGTLNRAYTRSGYLFQMEKKALGTTWNKCYCHYQRDGRLFCMIPYQQTTAKLVSTETFRLKNCIRRVSETIDKRFCFDIIPEERPGVVYTFQALSEEDCALWTDAMDGKEPMYVKPPKPGNAHHTYLDEAGFTFITKCFETLDGRGLEDQGLYRVVGVTSKVNRVLTMGLDRKKMDKLNFGDPMEVETKTLTSAVKTYLRNLPEPIMTYKMHSKFIAAAKLETYEARVKEVRSLVGQLPEPNKRMLELLLAHLKNVAMNAKQNMMNVSNLGVCFGPTLLRNEEETVAAIMDIKFGNVVVEIMIENWRHILRGDPLKFRRTSSSTASLAVHSGASLTTPPHIVSPNRPPPPPYLPPPAPHPSSSPLHPVIHCNGGGGQRPMNNVSPSQKDVAPMKRASSGIHLSNVVSNSSPNFYTSATWERSIRTLGNASSSGNKFCVPQPLGSAPPSSSMNLLHHRSVQTSSSVPPFSQRSPPPPPPPPPAKAELQRQSSSGSVAYPRVGGFHSSPDASDATNVDGRVAFKRKQRPNQPPPPAPVSNSIIRAKSKKEESHRFNSSSSSVDSYSSEGMSGDKPTHRRISSQAAIELDGCDVERMEDPAACAILAVESAVEASNAVVAAAAMFGSPAVKTSPQTATVQPLQQLLQRTTVTPMSSSSPSSTTSSTTAAITNTASLPSCKVRTLYACVGEHDSELSFEPNQIITNVRPSMEPGWLQGVLDGKVGLVPENYVEFIT